MSRVLQEFNGNIESHTLVFYLVFTFDSTFSYFFFSPLRFKTLQPFSLAIGPISSFF